MLQDISFHFNDTSVIVDDVDIYKRETLSNLAMGLDCERARKMLKLIAIAAVAWCINAKGIQLHLTGIQYSQCASTILTYFFSYISYVFAYAHYETFKVDEL